MISFLVTPRVSALAGCDRLVSEPLVLENSLIPLSRGSFDVIVGMDRLSKRKFAKVCHEKVVRIPLEGDEILRVHGERTQGVVKTLMNAKFRIDLVPEATSVAKSRYRLAPLGMQELLNNFESCKTRVSYDLVIFRGENQCRLLRREACISFEVSVGITEEEEVDVYLPLAEFSYDNSYSSIRCAPFEALYGRKCRSPILWAVIEESSMIGQELVQEMTNKVGKVISKLNLLVKSQDEISLGRGYCDNHDLSRKMGVVFELVSFKEKIVSEIQQLYKDKDSQPRFGCILAESLMSIVAHGNSDLYIYEWVGFGGFAAQMSAKEAKAMKNMTQILSVRPQGLWKDLNRWTTKPQKGHALDIPKTQGPPCQYDKEEQTNPQDSVRTTSAVDLEEFCEKHYEKLLPIMADKYEYEKRKKEKLEEVKARLDFGDARKKSTRTQESAYSESRTISPRRQRRSRSPRHNPSVFTRDSEAKDGVHPRTPIAVRKAQGIRKITLKAKIVKTDPFTSQIRHFDFPKTRMPSHVKTYNGSEDPEDHLKIFQATAKMKRWDMLTWCHMFNSTLTGNARVWFDDLPPESIDSYNDLREAFLKNYLQQKKCIRDPIVLHNIKQRDGESTEDFIQRYKSESGNVKGAPECMRISGFVHGITNPELIKRFHEKIPKTVDEMMQVATSFLQGQEAASNQERKKVPPAWRHQEGGHRQNFKKGGGFRSQHKQEKRPDRFTLLTKTPKEILALEKGKFKTPPPMTTPVEKRNANKFCEFHGEVGHNTDECNHLRKQIEDMLKAGKLSHIIRELKQTSGKEQPKKKGEISGKEKPQAILMIQSRQEAIRQKITQSFSPNPEMLFPRLQDDEGAEGPLIIEAEIGGHQVHRICVDGGSSFEILYEHCFNRLRPEIKNQMVPATTSLIGFSGEIKWPLGQITLLVKIGDDEHSTSAWMDFMVVRSTSPHNGIIGRPGLRKIQAVPSTAHGMIKFPVIGGILTLKGSKIIPVECAMVSGPEEQPILVNKVKEERVKVAINPEHPEQTVMIGSDLTEKTRSKLCNLLQKSLDIFAWTSTDMTGFPRQIAEHRLNVRKGCQPVRQKKRGQAV
ncbi:reverse transcriptase domain-containing protein [Tanacetum coccineum]